MKQYFKIGEISKLYQIGVDSLRYYEELGLLRQREVKMVIVCTVSMIFGG